MISNIYDSGVNMILWYGLGLVFPARRVCVGLCAAFPALVTTHILTVPGAEIIKTPV